MLKRQLVVLASFGRLTLSAKGERMSLPFGPTSAVGTSPPSLRLLILWWKIEDSGFRSKLNHGKMRILSRLVKAWMNIWVEDDGSQDRFIRLTGFNSIPARGSEERPRGSQDNARSDHRRRCSESNHSGGEVRPGTAGNSNSNSNSLSPKLPTLLLYPSTAILCPDCDRADKDKTAGFSPNHSSTAPTLSNRGGDSSRGMNLSRPEVDLAHQPALTPRPVFDSCPRGRTLQAPPPSSRPTSPGTQFPPSLEEHGINKSSLQRAQDLMCSKLKTVKSSYRRLCTPAPTEPSSLIPPSDDLLGASPHEQLEDAEPISDPPELSTRPEKEPPLIRDPAHSLYEQDIKKILSSCGISIREMEPSKAIVAVPQAGVCGDNPVMNGDFRTVDAARTRGGILTAWNNFLFDCIQYWAGSHMLNVLLRRKADGRLFLITNVYGPTENNSKATFFEELEVVNDTGLFDLPRFNGRNIPTLECLDCALISQDWFLRFPRSTLRALPHPRSDHTPLVVSNAWNSVNSSLESISRFGFKVDGLQKALIIWSKASLPLLINKPTPVCNG
uniref:Uncharacterized protein n=1 Tax=Ananas comosus var. bracteatus TaxID=296719 RepID=A0A6V7PJW1_ANACO|nr:unnamed protein product [Ananas comosus var. bracteatus]